MYRRGTGSIVTKSTVNGPRIAWVRSPLFGGDSPLLSSGHCLALIVCDHFYNRRSRGQSLNEEETVCSQTSALRSRGKRVDFHVGRPGSNPEMVEMQAKASLNETNVSHHPQLRRAAAEVFGDGDVPGTLFENSSQAVKLSRHGQAGIEPPFTQTARAGARAS